MDNQTALELVKGGATLLLLDVPQHTLIGIDTHMFSSGPNFMGIKMIPPGVHFFYYCSSNREGNEFSPIIGCFVDVQQSQVIVHKWDKEEEHFVKLIEEEEERYAEAVKRMEFDRQLGPYSFELYVVWMRLSNYITRGTIQRIEPIGGEITVTCETDMTRNIPQTAMEKALADQLENNKFARPAEKSQRKGCYYTPIPRLIKNRGLSREELTNLNVDKTQLLERILMDEYDGSEDLLLGELQFAFIAFLMGQSLEAFLQWKLLVSLLFGCTEAPLHTRTGLFTKFARVIYNQLEYGFRRNQKGTSLAENEASGLLDESWLLADSFLHHLCRDFFSVVLEAPVIDGDLLSWTRKLKEMLEDALGWDFQQNIEDDDEYAPAVVMLDDPIGNDTPHSPGPHS